MVISRYTGLQFLCAQRSDELNLPLIMQSVCNLFPETEYNETAHFNPWNLQFSWSSTGKRKSEYTRSNKLQLCTYFWTQLS